MTNRKEWESGVSRSVFTEFYSSINDNCDDICTREEDLNLIKCRALLDTCATANFITEKFAKSLRLPVISCTLPVGAINSMNTVSREIISVAIRLLHSEYCIPLSCLSIPSITEMIPAETFPRHLIKIPSNIKLANPEFHLSRSVDLLIGAGTIISLFSIGQINLSQGNQDLYLQKSWLGWVVAGGIASRSRLKNAICQLSNLE